MGFWEHMDTKVDIGIGMWTDNARWVYPLAANDVVSPEKSRMAMELMFHEEEWRFLEQFGGRDRKKREWITGRIAAKKAIADIFWKKYDITIIPSEWAVLPDKAGCPRVWTASGRSARREFDISISHAGNFAIALVKEHNGEESGVGIDIEDRNENHDGLAEGGFLADELALLSPLHTGEREQWILRLWCAKEAVAKSTGLGFAGDPFRMRVRSVDFVAGDVEIELDPEVERKTHPVMKRYRASSGEFGRFVCAVAMGAGGDWRRIGTDE